MSLYVYDIKPYSRLGPNKITFPFASTIKIRLEYNCNVKVFSVRAKPCSCDLSLSKYEGEKSNGNMLKHVNAIHYDFYGLKTLFDDFVFYKIFPRFKPKTQFVCAR